MTWPHDFLVTVPGNIRRQLIDLMIHRNRRSCRLLWPLNAPSIAFGLEDFIRRSTRSGHGCWCVRLNDTHIGPIIRLMRLGGSAMVAAAREFNRWEGRGGRDLGDYFKYFTYEDLLDIIDHVRYSWSTRQCFCRLIGAGAICEDGQSREQLG